MEKLQNEFLKNYHMDVNKENLIISMKENIERLKRHEIPDTYPEDIETIDGICTLSMQGLEFMRESIISLSSFPLITKTWINILADYLCGETCVEIMAGSGMLAYALREKGIHVIATDNKEWNWEYPWIDIKEMGYQETIRCYMRNCSYLILSWPEMGENAYHALELMRKANPEAKMIYIGEFGGCCADNKFVNEAQIVDEKWIRKINENFMHWAGIHDKVLILK